MPAQKPRGQNSEAGDDLSLFVDLPLYDARAPWRVGSLESTAQDLKISGWVEFDRHFRVSGGFRLPESLRPTTKPLWIKVANSAAFL